MILGRRGFARWLGGLVFDGRRGSGFVFRRAVGAGSLQNLVRALQQQVGLVALLACFAGQAVELDHARVVCAELSVSVPDQNAARAQRQQQAHLRGPIAIALR